MSAPLQDKVALVAGATRGAGRGIAVELGAAGATVYVTGRSTRARRSEYDRPETIEDTADLVTAAGGNGIAVPTDHLDRAQVEALVDRIADEQGRLDVLVNDIWGGEKLFEWDTPLWEHDLDNGLRLLKLAVETHAVTSHHALPLLLRNPGGLVVEVTDGTADYNAQNYRVNFFYDLAKASVLRMAFALGHELGPRGATAVAPHPRLAALGTDAGRLRRTGGELARRPGAGPPLRHLGDPALRGPGRGRTRRRRGRGALERAVAVQRRSRPGVRLHRRRRQPPGRLALPRGGAGHGEARGRHRIPVTRTVTCGRARRAVTARSR